jgi:hypothetical protein
VNLRETRIIFTYLSITKRKEALEEFTKSMLQKIVAEGYRFLLYTNLEHFAIITPLRYESNTNENSYIISIEDEQCEEMANGIEDFSFYVLSII